MPSHYGNSNSKPKANRPKKKQGYNARLDESLASSKRTVGASKNTKQTLKDRRDESEGMEKKMGRRKFARVSTMDKGDKKKAPKKKKTPKGMHRMPNGKLMKVEKHGGGKKK